MLICYAPSIVGIDGALFRNIESCKAVITAIKSGTFQEKNQTNKEVYELTAKEIGWDKDTVKSWTRATSKAPGNNDKIVTFEKSLAAPEDSVRRKEEKKMKNDKQEIRLTDFNKQAIHSCYMLMKDYIRSDEVEDEECFANMCAEVEKYRIAIPQEVYEEISKCIDEFLAPIVYENHVTFAQCFTDDLGSFDNEGVWHMKDEEAVRKSCMYFMMKLVEIEKSVDDFAMKKLYPILIQ